MERKKTLNLKYVPSIAFVKSSMSQSDNDTPNKQGLAFSNSQYSIDFGVGGRRSDVELEEGLFVWEEELVGELILVLRRVALQVDKEDMWLWNAETSHVYSVRSAYKLLTIQPPTVSVVSASSIWNKDVPLKVVLFAWRLF